MPNILVVDDEHSIREAILDVLQDEGFDAVYAANGEDALDILARGRVDIMLLDVWLPGIGGVEVLMRTHKLFPSVTVIMISGHGTVDLAVEAMKLGAFDFIEKPLSIDRLLLILGKACRMRELEEENRRYKTSASKDFVLIGSSPAMTKIRELIASSAAAASRVLISGESGTGKELVARSIWLASGRKNEPFIEVNCAAIPENLIESELFGHEKGAFTGAHESRKGKFELADTGTIFLDEVADMSLQTQAKVLRVLQEMEFERVGGSKTIHVDVRVIAASNKDLMQEISKGNFREDLFYRLNVIPIRLPSLRERIEDMPELVAYFGEQFCHKSNRSRPLFGNDAIEVMKRSPWRGNIRELRNMIERALTILSVSPIDAAAMRSLLGDVSPDAANAPGERLGEDEYDGLREARNAFEKEYILRKLRENGMNVSRTARVLGIERSNLHRKINSLGIDPGE
ncbi:MAG: sigma-54 dependent transcriptional regulator [Spirochaetota bacterium]|jgi:two-component system nitrogen regulation response regulator NtrX|nr:sigma-54 dependent transcriptional regulator [Spirochaetota bacterium]